MSVVVFIASSGPRREVWELHPAGGEGEGRGRGGEGKGWHATAMLRLPPTDAANQYSLS